ncbi:class I SAM-dependent RNA methyltransferase [Corynebacterium fournieri]|uniref:class I SAM-dependent RNA methyltransferase n=1 Tax=Corynebacterium fournieri TaxID=1852390 RepID=UPI001E322DC9|nr:TRAM domain-containing protein [Corynebacterium fournieri]WJY97716.1 putative RNA methyltransferase [Corynebacterium fournieri]
MADTRDSTGSPALTAGEPVRLHVRAMAHGGEGIADAPDGRVVFVRGAIPGDVVDATLTKVKKRWARAETTAVVQASAHRIEPTCRAAAVGAGCCDFSFIDPEAQLQLKREVLSGQLTTLSSRSGVLDNIDLSAVGAMQLQPVTGWRTRVRLGVDGNGRVGVRRARSTEVVSDKQCTQPVPSLLDGVVGEGARTFTPGAELVVAVDAEGARHVVETQAAQRGRRVERVERVLEGPGRVVERVRGFEYVFPPTAFWQAHRRAPEEYSNVIARWGRADYASRVGWDLYGGVGAFAPAIADALGGGTIESVDYSSAAAAHRQQVAEELPLHMHHGDVAALVGQLPTPGLVVLDPPRAGAGAQVVQAIAAARPERIIHVGCDPATFARDLAGFGEQGYAVTRMTLIDAFPNTHHFETIALLEPASRAG